MTSFEPGRSFRSQRFQVGSKMEFPGSPDRLSRRMLRRRSSLSSVVASKPKWSLVKATGEQPDGSFSHSCVSDDQYLFVFGGTAETSEGGGLNNALYRLSKLEQVWEQLHPTGDNPPERLGHTWSDAGNHIFLFGGYGKIAPDYTGPYQRLDDLHVYDKEKNHWEKLDAINPPSGRTGHSTIYHDGKLIVFGGYGKNEDGKTKTLNDLHVLDIETLTWSCPEVSGDTSPYVLIPRHGHSATVVEGKMYVFGGYSDLRDYSGRLNDVHIFNIEMNLWNKVETLGEGVLGRSGHSAVLYNDKLWIFGGMIAPPLKTREELEADAAQRGGERERTTKGRMLWSVASKGYTFQLAKDKSAAVTAVIKEAQAKNDMLLNDIDVLDLETLTWYYFEAEGTMVGRMGHSALMWGLDSMVVFGGSDGTGARSDTYVLPLHF